MSVKGRSQPANLLHWGNERILVDVGDGAAQRLAEAGIKLGAVHTLVLSHLHFDHTGGVAAVLGLRWQTNVPGKLSIVGPPGTRAFIDALIASMQPGADAGYGIPGAKQIDPATTVSVHELQDGETLSLGGAATMTAVQNTHYSFASGSPEDLRSKSFSFRFDLPGRAIVYTGDTGPSPELDRLGKGADLLVAEMIDPVATITSVRRLVPTLNAEQLRNMEFHLTTHHLVPEDVGAMAAHMGVRRVVVTHLAIPDASRRALAAYERRIRRRFGGEVLIAHDLADY